MPAIQLLVFPWLRDRIAPTIVSHLPMLISLIGCQKASEDCDRYENEGDHRHTKPALPNTNVHTQSEEEADMVYGGTTGAYADIKAGSFPATVSAGRMKQLACAAVDACRRA